MRPLIINYAGDVREAFFRLEAGGNETYYAQKYSIESYKALRKYADQVAVLACITPENYNEELFDGFYAIGCGFQTYSDDNQAKLIQIIEDYNPTHLILGIPDRGLLNWAFQKNLPTITVFANTIAAGSSNFLKKLVRQIRNFLLARSLNQKNIEWVGSYGINSSIELQRAGVDAEKIIPWDYLVDTTPGTFKPKLAPTGGKPFTLCYVGTICEDKGVGDLLEAIAQLKAKDFPIQLNLIGSDAGNYAGNIISRLGIEDCVKLLGFVANHTIEPTMHETDLVIVPSRYQYPEGFPLVIHHALRACTPIIASNHPMFASHLLHQVNAMIFPAGNATAMARCIEDILTNADLYKKISAASHSTWYQLRLPVKWADLTLRWVSQIDSDRQWLADYNLASLKTKNKH